MSGSSWQARLSQRMDKGMKGLDLRIDGVNVGYIIQIISSAILAGKVLRVQVSEWREKRSLSQNALQHVIYSDISKYLISKGRKDWTPEYTKKQLKNKFLGWVNEEYIDIETGERTIKSVLKPTAGLDKGDAYHYTTQIIEWAESIGCEIRIPAKCEYRELMERQNV